MSTPKKATVKDLVRLRGCVPMGEYACQIPMPIRGRLQGIDFCISDIVVALNAANLTTVASCCGHGNESIARIDLDDGRVLHVTGHTPNVDDRKVMPQRGE